MLIPKKIQKNGQVSAIEVINDREGWQLNKVTIGMMKMGIVVDQLGVFSIVLGRGYGVSIMHESCPTCLVPEFGEF